MTRAEIPVMCDACPARRSTLPFDLADMVAVRLLPAQFARIVGVSKQAVSKWIAAGKVTLGPDGRLDPQVAIQDVLRNTAPAKLRARIFRQAMQGADAMRGELRALQRKCEALELENERLAAQPAMEAAELREQLRAADRVNTKIRDQSSVVARQAGDAFRRDLLRRFDALAAARSRSWDELAFELESIQSTHFKAVPGYE